MPTDLPVFVNGRPYRAPAGSTLGRLLAEHDPDLFVALLGGQALATDGRGIEADPDVPLTAGAIFRVQRSARAADA
ncbi:MAG: hypothetical protein ABJC19_04270 [Gemmatimonadota bacterium]